MKDLLKENEDKMNTPLRHVVFIREDMFYPLSIPEGTIADNADCNPGTLRVEDAMTGEILWPISEHRHADHE